MASGPELPAWKADSSLCKTDGDKLGAEVGPQ